MDKRGLNFFDEKEEYSEAGRAINPNGLYLISKEIQKRFGNIPQFITENGIADSTDYIRPSYLIEHLKVVSALTKEDIRILGYIHWTLTDNMEWADGYCPKFGLVEVDRNNNLERIKRPSYYLYQKIIREKEINLETQALFWKLLQSQVGKSRAFCRSQDGKTGLDDPIDRSIRSVDWRFKQQ